MRSELIRCGCLIALTVGFSWPSPSNVALADTEPVASDLDAPDEAPTAKESYQLTSPPFFNSTTGRNGNTCTISASFPGWGEGGYKMDSEVVCQWTAARLELYYGLQYWNPTSQVWVQANQATWFANNASRTPLRRITAPCLNTQVYVRSVATANVYWTDTPNDASSVSVASNAYLASSDCF